MNLRILYFLSAIVILTVVSPSHVFCSPPDLPDLQATNDISDTEMDGGEDWSTDQIRNIVPEGHYYLAMESRDYAKECHYAGMTEKQLKKTLEYQLYKDPTTGAFLVGIDNSVFLQAELYCQYHGFDSVASVSMEFLNADEFPVGQVFTLEWLDGYKMVTQLKRQKWDLNPFERILAKRRKLNEYCPHIAFSEIWCKKNQSASQNGDGQPSSRESNKRHNS